MRLKSILAFLLLPVALMGAPTNLVDNIRINSSFRLIPGAVAGNVLVSDLNGFGSWTVPIAGGDVYQAGFNQFTGTNTFVNGNLAIGTNAIAPGFDINWRAGVGGQLARIAYGVNTEATFAFYNDSGTKIGALGAYTSGVYAQWFQAGSGSFRLLDSAGSEQFKATDTLLTIGASSAYSMMLNNATATTPNGLSWNSGQWNLRTTGNNSMSGKLSIGSDINPTSGILQIAGTWTNFHGITDTGTYTRTSGNVQHWNIAPTITVNGSSISTTLRIVPTINVMSNMTSVQQINIAPTYGTGTAGVTNSVVLQRSLLIGAGAGGTGTVIFGSFYGAQINDPNFSSNVISNDFGLHIENRTGGLTTRANIALGAVPTSGNWGIYNNSIYTNYTASPLFLGSLTAGNAITSVLAGTATLSYAGGAAGSTEDQTITVTGAAVNDTVALGLPADVPTDSIFWGFVSAANTVTIRRTATVIAAAYNTKIYKVTVIHH